MAKDISIEIGFVGGGSTAVALPEDQLEGFTKALTTEHRDRWYKVTSSDGGEFLVDLSNIVFARVGARGRSIGFAHV